MKYRLSDNFHCPLLCHPSLVDSMPAGASFARSKPQANHARCCNVLMLVLPFVLFLGPSGVANYLFTREFCIRCRVRCTIKLSFFCRTKKRYDLHSSIGAAKTIVQFHFQSASIIISTQQAHTTYVE